MVQAHIPEVIAPLPKIERTTVSRLVGIKHVAAEAGVSVGTVSNVLNQPDKVSDAARLRVQQAIKNLGFVRNESARELRAGRSRTIGLVVLDIGNPFFSDVARGAEGVADTEDLLVVLGNSAQDALREEKYISLFEERRFQGVLIAPIGEPGERLHRLRRRGIHAILVDRLDDSNEFCSVSVDDVAGGKMAINHLVDQGRTRIAFVGGPTSLHQVRDREAGAREAVRYLKGVSISVIGTVAPSLEEGRVAGRKLLEIPSTTRPDAIFAANDLLALGILQVLTAAGIHVPDDIAMIGFDDIEFATSAMVSLSSIRRPGVDLGEAALRLLLEEIDHGEDHAHTHVVFEPELIIRESTAVSHS